MSMFSMQGVKFNGESTTYGELDSDIGKIQDGFTLFVRFKPFSDGIIVMKDLEYIIEIINNILYFKLYNGVDYEIIQSSEIIMNGWNAVAVRYENGVKYLYIKNDKYIKVSDIQTTISNGSINQIKLGLFDGIIDDFRYYPYGVDEVFINSILSYEEYTIGTGIFNTFEEINGNVSVDVDNMSNIILYGDYKIVDGKEFDNLKDEDFIVEKVVLIEKSR